MQLNKLIKKIKNMLGKYFQRSLLNSLMNVSLRIFQEGNKVFS